MMKNRQNLEHTPTGWAVFLSAWLVFGFSTYLNTKTLRAVNTSPDDFIFLPETLREVIWLVLGIWLAAYIASAIVGFLHHKAIDKGRITASAVMGYWIGLVLHIIFLNTFPNTPNNSFSVILDVANLRPLPLYYTFILFTVVVGPLIATLSAYTSILLSKELDDWLPNIQTDARMIIVMAVLPLALLLFRIGYYNYDHQAWANQLWIEANRTSRDVTPFIILNLNLLIDAQLAMATLSLLGALIGIRFTAPNAASAAIDALIGGAIYVLIVMLLKQLLVPYADPNIPSEFVDHLGPLQAPTERHFVLLYFIPPLLGMAAAFSTYLLRSVFLPVKRHQVQETLPQ